jgi:endonuclease G
MKHPLIFIVALLSIAKTLLAQHPYVNEDNINSDIKTIDSFEIPLLSTNETIIYHTGYTLSYNETYEQANWVAYELTNEETQANAKRTNRFIIDPLVTTQTANNQDYMGSGYDKGHLAPAADMAWSEISMVESFYFSNMSPQAPSFNRGIWNKLEDQVRTWAKEYEAVYVITGPVLKDELPTIGSNKVAIPEYYYKVILDYRKPEIKAIGFIMPNEASKEPLQHFAVTVDSVEAFTGINFFHQLPDDEEQIIESNLQINQWIWRKTKPSK